MEWNCVSGRGPRRFGMSPSDLRFLGTSAIRAAACASACAAFACSGVGPAGDHRDKASGAPTVTDAGPAALDAGHEEVPVIVRQLIALGSSSTAGAGASSSNDSYVSLVARAFGASVVNLGAGGQRVADVERSKLAQALAALDAPPPAGARDVVSFLPFTDYVTGTPEAVSAGYDRVLAVLAPTGAAVAFGLLVLDDAYVCGRGTSRGPDGLCYDDALADGLDAMEAAVRAMLTAHPHVFIVEVTAQSVQHPEWDAPDGHPNDRGHRYLADLFVDAIHERTGARVVVSAEQ